MIDCHICLPTHNDEVHNDEVLTLSTLTFTQFVHNAWSWTLTISQFPFSNNIFWSISTLPSHPFAPPSFFQKLNKVSWAQEFAFLSIINSVCFFRVTVYNNYFFHFYLSTIFNIAANYPVQSVPFPYILSSLFFYVSQIILGPINDSYSVV